MPVVVVALAVAAALLPRPAVGATDGSGEVPPQPPPAAEAARDATDLGAAVAELAPTAAEEGRVRVLVEFDPGTDLEPEGRLPRAAVAAQRDEIATARRRVERAVPATERRVVAPFATIPAVGMAVTEEGLRALAEAPGVTAITEERRLRPALGTSVPRIEGDVLHGDGHTGDGQAIAVLDTGTERDHPAFADRVVEEACFALGEELLDQQNGDCPDGTARQVGPGSAAPMAEDDVNFGDRNHGTHVAGIAAGEETDELDAGVAPDADILALRVFSMPPSPDESAGAGGLDVLTALEYVLDATDRHDIAAVNLSLGGDEGLRSPCDTDPGRGLVEHLAAAGVATVVSSGNAGHTDAMAWPACVPGVLSVGATDHPGDEVPAYSNVADFLTVLAPGTGIRAAFAGGEAGFLTGTSMAAPHVAGGIAVLQGATDETVSAGRLRDALVDTAEPVPDERDGVPPGVTYPEIRLAAALDHLETETVDTAVSGLVFDRTTDERINGATVEVRDADGALVGDGQSDADGTYRVEVDAAGELTVAVAHADYAHDARAVVDVAADETTVHHVGLGRFQARIEGLSPTLERGDTDEFTATIAYDGSGHDVVAFLTVAAPSNAARSDWTPDVSVTPGGYFRTSRPVEEFADADGSTAEVTMSIQDDAPVGGFIMSVVLWRLAPDGALEELLGVTRATFDVEGAPVLEGRLTDADTGAPLTDAQVSVSGDAPAGHFYDTIHEVARTDADGRYAVPDTPDGTYAVTASADGYASATVTRDLARGTTVTRDFALGNLPPGVVAGTVTDVDSGAEIAGASIVLLAGNNEVADAETDDDGGFVLEAVAPGDYTLSTSADGYETDERAVTVESDAMTSVEVALTPTTGVIEGTVRDAESGAAVADAHVVLIDDAGVLVATTTSVGDGGFGFDAVDPGAYTLTGSAEGYESATVSVSVSVGQTTLQDIQLTPEPATACRDQDVPPAGFSDVSAASPHAGSIDCAVWHDIARGVGGNRYEPTRAVNRGQMATFIANVITTAGGTLPAPADQGFTDIAGNPHEDRINQLAAVGVVRGVGGNRYAPGAQVPRAAMTTFLVNAYEHVAAQQLPREPSGFTDIAGNPHEGNIERAAAAELARGRSATEFGPAGLVTREAMASFLVNLLERFAAEGRVTPPG